MLVLECHQIITVLDLRSGLLYTINVAQTFAYLLLLRCVEAVK